MLLIWLTDSYIWVRATEQQRAALGLKQPHGIGYGIGLAIALFAMQGTPLNLRIWSLSDVIFRGIEFGELTFLIPSFGRSLVTSFVDE